MPIKPCSVLWTDINVNVHRKEIVNCCKRNQRETPTVEDFKKQGIDFWTGRPEVKEDKEYFLTRMDFPPGCKGCALYHPDSRYSTHNRWKNKDIEFFNNLQDNHTYKIEIALSSTCNQTCMYCTPEVSSLWAKKLGLPILEPDLEWRNAMFESLYNFIEARLLDKEKVEYIFLGGETFLEPDFLDIIDKISSIHNLQRQNITIRFITNANVGPSVIQKFVDLTDKHFNIKFEVAVSIENLNHRAEAVREGLDFKRLEQNLATLLKADNIYVGIMPSYNVFSVAELLDFHKWMLKTVTDHRSMHDFGKKWTVYMNLIYEPTYMSFGILPDNFKYYVQQTIEWVESIKDIIGKQDVKDINQYILQLEQIKNLIGTKRKDIKFMQSAKQWYKEQEKIHNRNYWETFAEMELIFDSV